MNRRMFITSLFAAPLAALVPLPQKRGRFSPLFYKIGPDGALRAFREFVIYKNGYPIGTSVTISGDWTKLYEARQDSTVEHSYAMASMGLKRFKWD